MADLRYGVLGEPWNRDGTPFWSPDSQYYMKWDGDQFVRTDSPGAQGTFVDPNTGIEMRDTGSETSAGGGTLAPNYTKLPNGNAGITVNGVVKDTGQRFNDVPASFRDYLSVIATFAAVIYGANAAAGALGATGGSLATGTDAYAGLGADATIGGGTESLGLGAGTEPLQIADASLTDVPVEDILPGDPGYVPPDVPVEPPPNYTGAPYTAAPAAATNWAPVEEVALPAASAASRFIPSSDTIKNIANVTGILGGAATVYGAGKVIAGGGTTTTTTGNITPPPATPGETGLTQAQIDAYNRALDAYNAALTRDQAHDPGAIRDYVMARLYNADGTINRDGIRQIEAAARKFGITVTEIADATGFTSDEITQNSGLRLTAAEQAAADAAEISRLNLDRLRQGTNATPEQITQIDAATAAAQTQGEIDINRFRDETLARINEEVALASGLSPTDTPISALNDRTAAEVVRQQGNLTSTLAGANANARLNYPLAAQTVANATATTAGNLNLATQQFQADLAQTAVNNRYRLFSPPTAAGSFSLGLGNQRISTGTASSTSTRGLGIGDYSNILSGVGSVIRGVGSLGLGS